MRLTVFGSCRQDALYEHYDVTSIRNRLTYPHYSKEIVQAIEFCKGMALIPEHLTQQAFRTGILERRKIDANEFMQEFAETDMFVVEIASRICYTYRGVYVHHILTEEQYGFHDRAAIQIRDLTDEEIETDLLRMRELLSPKPFLVVTHISTRSEGKRHELVRLLKRLGEKHGIPVLDPIEALAPLPTIAPLFQQEAVLSHYTDFGRKMIGDAYKARITELLSANREGTLNDQPAKPVSPMGLDALRVYESTYPKKRLGSSGDGGYVVADISGYDGLISCGISDNIDFERAFLQEHPVPCLAFDGTVAGLPPGPKSNILFYKLNVGHKNGEKTTNLHREMEAFHDAFLKMDIETYEFRWLHSLSEEQLQRFKQIVIEFHFPFTIHPHAGLDFQIPVAQKLAALEKLAATHTLVHLHGNNCCGTTSYNGIVVPNVFECTYVRRNIQDGGQLNREPIPSQLDSCNVAGNDIILNWPPFVNTVSKKTAVLVWKQLYCNRGPSEFWGLGDLIRGICATHMICAQNGYELLVDMSQHPIGELIEPMEGLEPHKEEIHKRSLGLFFECASTLGELEHTMREAFATTNTFYFNTNGPLMRGQEFPEATKQFVRNLLRPKPEMQAYLEARMGNSDPYTVLHMRLGDGAGLTKGNSLCGLIEGFRTIRPEVGEIFQRNYSTGDVFLSDSKVFKAFIRSIVPDVRMFDTTPTHVGTSGGGQELIETFFEFLVATRAAKIKTYSVYEWVSGFVSIANKVFDVPLEVMG